MMRQTPTHMLRYHVFRQCTHSNRVRQCCQRCSVLRHRHTMKCHHSHCRTIPPPPLNRSRFPTTTQNTHRAGVQQRCHKLHVVQELQVSVADFHNVCSIQEGKDFPLGLVIVAPKHRPPVDVHHHLHASTSSHGNAAAIGITAALSTERSTSPGNE
eukprot:GHRQ01024867.1.p1 GENE.GHRQ01024867.1~~GHRQ01024867.1.p1  ORF type:complete len:156 (+),score=12.43 GHRQ01024867.1:32-499(+)